MPPTIDVAGLWGGLIWLLERIAQDTSLAARKCKSWSHIAHLFDKTEPRSVAALADSDVSVVSADKPGELAALLFP